MSELPPDRSEAERTSLGRRLQRAREGMGLTHAEVAAKLKLSSRQIEAMEQEDWNHLPELPYARGFYRNYARLLGLDPSSLNFSPALSPQQAIDQPTPLDLPSQELDALAHREQPQRRRTATWLIPLMLLLALAAGVAYLQWSGEELPRSPSSTAPAQEPLKSPVGKQPAPEPTSPAISVPPPSPAVSAPAPESASAAITSSPGQRRIRLVFEGKSWTEIRSGGEIIFSETAAPGIREFEAASPLSFVIGNASMVKLEIDGKPHDFSSSIRNEVARFQLP